MPVINRGVINVARMLAALADFLACDVVLITRDRASGQIDLNSTCPDGCDTAEMVDLSNAAIGRLMLLDNGEDRVWSFTVREKDA